MTLKQDKLIKAIPTSKTLLEAGKKAGYSPTAGNLYKKATKSHIQKVFAEQGITKDTLKQAYEECLDLCRTKEDYSTFKATIDSLAKLFGHLKDNNQQNVAIIDVINSLKHQESVSKHGVDTNIDNQAQSTQDNCRNS